MTRVKTSRGNTAKAIDYLELANRKAAKANAMIEAKTYFAQALTLLEHMNQVIVVRQLVHMPRSC